ncbi:glycosyltransferase [Streptomyces sp. TRM43335]|uniref:Glycosyltransferase n=1 Tax=Streptomyces taklimakanensis TaxID=2569853 RepID=A0A6G2BIZ1_9ACTN|nr:glycosyltransferase [Streptomyces taklimakanensis]MTE22257.1 glycosyltransferase [Streptomyces taklimakanensis]
MTEFRVSVVIPVYNAADHLDECLESLTAQTIGFERIEVLAVDDGSTDASGELLDAWAARHPNVRVFHQPNSGAPGGPRNRAIEVAGGEFLFFADPDDRLGPEAFERMLAAADRNGSDVVLGRIRGVGRSAPKVAFARNVERGDIHTTHVVWSLTAHKLFRRSLVMEHGLRFAEGVRLAEEQPFVVPAYFLARSISVVADYDCYHLVEREGFGHLTKELPEPEPFYAAVRVALETVVRHTEPGRRRNRLLQRWARLEILNKFGARYARCSEDLRERYAREAGRLLRDFVPREVVDGLPPVFRQRARMLRDGRTADLVALARHDDLDWAEAEGVAWLSDGRRFSVDIRSGLYLRESPEDLRHRIVLRQKDGHEVAVPADPTVVTGSPMVRRLVVDPTVLFPAVFCPGAWRIAVRVESADGDRYEVPVRFPGGHVPEKAGARRLLVNGARPMLVRLHRDSADKAVLTAAHGRAVADAVRRRLLSRA